jgi:hypothetical protein
VAENTFQAWVLGREAALAKLPHVGAETVAGIRIRPAVEPDMRPMRLLLTSKTFGPDEALAALCAGLGKLEQRVLRHWWRTAEPERELLLKIVKANIKLAETYYTSSADVR